MRSSILPAFLLSVPHVVEQLGIPALPTSLQPFLTPTRTFPVVGMPALPLGGGYNRLTYVLAEAFVTLLLRGRINRWRTQTLGLPRYQGPGLFSALRQPGTPTLYGFSPTVLPKPADWGAHVHVTGYWFLPPQEWQPPEALRRFLAAGPAPVYIGFGSIAYPNPSRLMQTVLEAIQHAKVRAIVASGWSGLQPNDLPDNVLLIDSAPHDWLFPRVAAAVHHGGAGTVAASLRAGLPSLVIPFMADQPIWGQRVHALGAGPPPIPAGAIVRDRLWHRRYDRCWTMRPCVNGHKRSAPPSEPKMAWHPPCRSFPIGWRTGKAVLPQNRAVDHTYAGVAPGQAEGPTQVPANSCNTSSAGAALIIGSVKGNRHAGAYTRSLGAVGTASAPRW